MWGNPLTELLPYMSNYVVTTGANLLIHSTIILSAGLLGAYALKEKGAAAQSIVLRVFLAAFLLCTPVSIILHEAGIGGLTITVPLTVPQKPTDNEIPILTERKTVETSNVPVKKLSDRRTKTGIENEALQHEKPAVSSVNTHDRFPVRSQHTIITSAQDEKENTPARPEIRQTEIQPKNNLAVLYMLLAVVWTVLTLIVLTRLILNNLYLVYVRFTAVQAKQSFLDASKYAALELTMRAPVVLQSPSVKSPFAAGILKQYIILPLGKHETGLPEKEVFLHELAHLKRHDPFWNLLVRLTRIIIPFQPLIWIYTRWIAVTNDYVCDDYVMNSIENHRSYASDLAHLARHYHPRGHEIAAGAGFISVKSSLRRRIARILDVSRKLSLRVSARLVFTISLLCAFITFVTGFIGIKGKNNIQESYASEKKPDEESKKISAKTHDTELPVRDTVVSSERYDRPPVNDTPVVITEHPENNANESGTAVHEDSGLSPGSTETYSAAVMQHPYEADSDEIVEFSALNKDPGPEPGSSAENETIEAADTTTEESVTEKDTGEHDITNTVVINDSAAPTVSTIESYTRFETAASYAVSSGEIDNLALKTLDIVISYDFENADLTDPEEKKLFSIYMSLNKNKMFPVWSPDGKWIAFSDRNFGIWVVPSEGGEPRLLYENYYNVKYKEYSLHLNGLKTLGFSPDGKKITFIKYIIDEERGTEVFFDTVDQNTFSNIINPVPVIATVDIQTKESSVLVENAVSGRWSNSGRYFAYIRRNMDSYNELLIYDTETGNEWGIDARFPESVYFSHDDSHIFYSDFELFKVPLHGGEPEQMTDFGLSYISDYSRDGEWILYADDNFNQGVYNTISGEKLDALPWAALKTYWTNFSPDGKKICFGLKHIINDEIEWGIYTYDFDLPSEQTGIDEINIPLDFKLHVNYPNPFNSFTTIEFSLAESNHTTLIIYNMAGQKIRDLVSENLIPGTHRVTWNGCDDNGNKVSSGVYLPTLKSGKNFDTGRITMVK